MASRFEWPSRLILNDARIFRTARPARTSEGRFKAVAKAGRRQHSKRLEPATRISRVAQTWPIRIGALTIIGMAVCLHLMQAARRWVSVRVAYRESPTGRPRSAWPRVGRASFAANALPRRRAPGFRCLTRFSGTIPSRRGTCRGCGASCDDSVDPTWNLATRSNRLPASRGCGDCSFETFTASVPSFVP